MVRKALIFLLLAVTQFAVPAAAQSSEELKFRQKQAGELHGYAETAFKKGFPQVARRVWLMLLSEYDADHAEARAALGYEQVGDSWAQDPEFVYPKSDEPDAAAAKSLQKKWESVAKKVAKAHLKMAGDYEKAGRTDMARWHYEKVIYFVPDDEEAKAALEHKPVEGLTGTDLEQTLWERSKAIERAVAEQTKKDYPVERLPDSETNALLEKAKVPYVSVRSEHFTVRGDFEPELLIEAAVNAERALRVLRVAYDGVKGFNDDPNRWLRDWAYFKDKETYVQILNANADLMSPADLKFRAENTAGCSLRTGTVSIDVNAAGNEQGILDGAVRSVAQWYSGFAAPALTEGIGHTFVGMFFNNNRRFIVDRKEQLRTTTGEEDYDKYSPNMDTWKDLALEAAWRIAEGTQAAMLPLVTADKFPDDARIKSWSFCDYLVRRDPALLRSLDSFKGEPSPIEVEKKFAAANDGLTLPQLEKEWKDFWTEASPVLKAIRDNTEPLTVVSKDAEKWLESFNDARKEQNSASVTWSASYTGRCKEHVAYLQANEAERGAAAEQGEDIDLPEGTHLGNMFAQMALVCTDAKKPKTVFKRWLDWPGYRDALLNERLLTIGLYAEREYLVMDAIRGVGRPPSGKGGYRVFPNSNKQSVPNQVAVADLGPELQALLERHGRGDQEAVGFPISLHHFGTGGVAGSVDTYQCKVTILGDPVEGIIHIADGGSNRRTSAPGLVVFYPLEPLKKGAEVEAVWTFEHPEGTARTAVKFNT